LSITFTTIYAGSGLRIKPDYKEIAIMHSIKMVLPTMHRTGPHLICLINLGLFSVNKAEIS